MELSETLFNFGLIASAGADQAGSWIGEWSADSGTLVKIDDVKFDSANSFIYVLLRESGTGNNTATLVQMNYEGNINWQKTVGYLFSSNIAIDSSGNVYVGTDEDSVEGIVKFDSSGTVQAQIQINGNWQRIRLLVDGSRLLAFLGASGSRVYLLSLSLALAINWQEALTAVSSELGGIAVDGDGDIYVSFLTDDGGDNQTTVAKFDTLGGTALWISSIQRDASSINNIGVYGSHVYVFGRDGQADGYRFATSTGVLDTSWKLELSGAVVESATKIDSSSGAIYRMVFDDNSSSTDIQEIRFSTSSFGVELTVTPAVTAANPNITSWAFDYDANYVVTTWFCDNADASPVMAFFPKDGSLNSGAVSLGANTYTWSSDSAFTTSTTALTTNSGGVTDVTSDRTVAALTSTPLDGDLSILRGFYA